MVRSSLASSTAVGNVGRGNCAMRGTGSGEIGTGGGAMRLGGLGSMEGSRRTTDASSSLSCSETG